jgi:uncharacterized protein YeaC (DUF1315 family)
MTERLMAKLDRLGAEAGIKQMTPEIYRFSMLVRADVVAQWPQRPWVGLTDEQIDVIYEQHHNQYGECESPNFGYERAIEAKSKELNT